MSKIVKSLGQLDKSLSKEDLVELAQQNANEIFANPRYDLMKVFVEFKRYEVYLKTLMNEVKSETFKRAKECNQEEFEFENAKVSIYKMRKFNYSADPKWDNLNKEITFLKGLKKERESLLKNITGDTQEIVNEETGEVETIHPPSVQYTEGLRIKL